MIKYKLLGNKKCICLIHVLNLLIKLQWFMIKLVKHKILFKKKKISANKNKRKVTARI